MGNKIRNTTRDADVNPAAVLLEELATGGHGVEAQEARGQQELVNSDVLPIEGLQPWRDEVGVQQTLESLGVIFGERVEGDELFINVTLPEGWKKIATDHSMWSDLMDDQDNIVANIFYKAAFYDRKAAINLA